MSRTSPFLAALLLTLGTNVQAATIVFDTDPFDGAVLTAGRDVIGGETQAPFNIATDVFAFDPAIFGIGDQVLFANDIVGNIPSSGVNVVVLQTLDNDGNAGTPFGAGNAATLIANQITAPGPGFFVYFNSGLNLPRLVFSTDLDDPTADLKILYRMTNLVGESDQLPLFTAANFDILQAPEPSLMLLLSMAGALGGMRRLRRRRAGD